jgi:hypothetical protein
MASPSNPTNIRSDVIDTTYAAYATFFDGLYPMTGCQMKSSP